MQATARRTYVSQGCPGTSIGWMVVVMDRDQYQRLADGRVLTRYSRHERKRAGSLARRKRPYESSSEEPSSDESSGDESGGDGKPGGAQPGAGWEGIAWQVVCTSGSGGDAGIHTVQDFLGVNDQRLGDVHAEWPLSNRHLQGAMERLGLRLAPAGGALTGGEVVQAFLDRLAAAPPPAAQPASAAPGAAPVALVPPPAAHMGPPASRGRGRSLPPRGRGRSHPPRGRGRSHPPRGRGRSVPSSVQDLLALNFNPLEGIFTQALQFVGFFGPLPPPEQPADAAPAEGGDAAAPPGQEQQEERQPEQQEEQRESLLPTGRAVITAVDQRIADMARANPSGLTAFKQRGLVQDALGDPHGALRHGRLLGLPREFAPPRGGFHARKPWKQQVRGAIPGALPPRGTPSLWYWLMAAHELPPAAPPGAPGDPDGAAGQPGGAGAQQPDAAQPPAAPPGAPGDPDGAAGQPGGAGAQQPDAAQPPAAPPGALGGPDGAAGQPGGAGAQQPDAAQPPAAPPGAPGGPDGAQQPNAPWRTPHMPPYHADFSMSAPARTTSAGKPPRKGGRPPPAVIRARHVSAPPP